MAENTTETKYYIPNFAYPFKKIKDSKQCFEELENKAQGNYLFSKNGLWHGGMHFDSFFDNEIRAIANGELVAYRINDIYLDDEIEEKELYSNGFFLVKHYFEYPKDNKLIFFSLYMHTANKTKYNEEKETTSTYIVKSGDSLSKIAKDNNTTVSKLQKDNNIANANQISVGQKLIIKSKTTDRKPKFIIENPKYNSIEVLTTPKEIKAGEVLGLSGIYGRVNQKGNETTHIEVFTKDDIKAFVKNAKKHYEDVNIPKDEKPNPIQIKIPKDIKEYKKDKCYLIESSVGYTNLRKAYKKTDLGYKTIKVLNSDVKIEINQSTLNSNRYLVTKIEEAQISSQNFTVHKDYIKEVFEYKETNIKNQEEKLLKISEIEKQKDINDIECIVIEDKYFLYSDCKEIHPITFDWAKIIDIQSNDKISIFNKLSNYIIPSLQKDDIKLNSSYKELFELIDKDNNNMLDVQELEDASKSSLIKETTSKYIVKHSSEWDKSTNMADVLLNILKEHKEEFEEFERIEEYYKKVKKRIENLSFFSECSSIEGFPSSDEVYHINPIGLVGVFKQTKRCYCYEQGIVFNPCNGEGISILNEHYEKLAQELGVEKEVLQTVAKVESGSRGSFQRQDPKHATILYEYNHMRKYLIEKGYSNVQIQEYIHTVPHLVNTYRAVPFGTNNEQLTKLEEAKKIDFDSAIKSCSWGKFQVLGKTYKWLYKTPTELEEAMNMCEIQQMAYFKEYLKNVNGMISAMKNKDWEKIAELYNGKNYKDWGYDTKMKDTYKSIKGH